MSERELGSWGTRLRSDGNSTLKVNPLAAFNSNRAATAQQKLLNNRQASTTSVFTGYWANPIKAVKDFSNLVGRNANAGVAKSNWT